MLPAGNIHELPELLALFKENFEWHSKVRRDMSNTSFLQNVAVVVSVFSVYLTDGYVPVVLTTKCIVHAKDITGSLKDSFSKNIQSPPISL